MFLRIFTEKNVGWDYILLATDLIVKSLYITDGWGVGLSFYWQIYIFFPHIGTTFKNEARTIIARCILRKNCKQSFLISYWRLLWFVNYSKPYILVKSIWNFCSRHLHQSRTVIKNQIPSPHKAINTILAVLVNYVINERYNWGPSFGAMTYWLLWARISLTFSSTAKQEQRNKRR